MRLSSDIVDASHSSGGDICEMNDRALQVIKSSGRPLNLMKKGDDVGFRLRWRCVLGRCRPRGGIRGNGCRPLVRIA